MKKKKFPTFRLRNEDGSYQLIEYDPNPPPMPPGWIEKVMTEIRKIGPLRKNSSANDGTG